MSVKTGNQATKLLRRLKEYVGDIASLTTTQKSTIVGALNELRAQMADIAYTAAGLTIGTTSAAKVKIANTVTYTIGGIFKSKTTAEVAFTATTHDIAADAAAVQEAVYLYTLQADGTVTVTMGTIASGAGNAAIPSPPAGECVIGYLRLAVAAGSTDFDATSDDLDAGHLTDTYVDVSWLE